ncbi:MAG TPA: hypothetical protein H9903_09020 [Candidatus Aquabacterium excrementipullorum]|nr:hypothetical protein [Candidatus Aquabacterium excrementipullorum]
MLKLTQEQFEWLRGTQQSRVNLALVAALDTQWPDLAAKLGARKHAFIEAALAQADQLGMGGDAGIEARFVNLWCVWGPSFVDKPGFEWAATIARDIRLDAWAKIEQLTLRSLDMLQRQMVMGVTPDKFDAADEAMAAAVGSVGGGLGAPKAGRPAVRDACDLSAFDVAISDQPWRVEYRMAWSGSEAVVRLAPLVVPAQRYRTDMPRPPGQPQEPRQIAALAQPASRGHKAWLLARSTVDHVCDADVHPHVEIKTDAGGQVFDGAAAWTVKVPLHSVDLLTLPPPFPMAPPDAGTPPKPSGPVRTDFTKGLLCREVPPRYLHVSAQTCGHRRYGAPLGEQEAVVAVHPADQWLLELKTAPQPLWHWPQAQPSEMPPPPVVRLERDGEPLPSSDWARAWTQLNATLAQGLGAWHDGLLKQQVLLHPQLDVEPGLMHGSMAWTWGMREMVQAEGSSAHLRVQALVRLMACSMNLQVAGELRHQTAHARIRLHAQGKAPLEADLLHESPEPPLPGKLAALKAAWRFPFTVEVESMSSPALGTMTLLPGGKPVALVGELGLRPRPDGAGWAWYCLVKLEAALVPLRVSDPQHGQTFIQRDLWPETVLLDWSAG